MWVVGAGGNFKTHFLFPSFIGLAYPSEGKYLERWYRVGQRVETDWDLV